MTRYRPHAVLLLLLLLTQTACTSWQPITTPSPPQFVAGEWIFEAEEEVATIMAAERPDRVRVTERDGTELFLEYPWVQADELVETIEEVSVRVPLGDIFRLEVRRFSVRRTVVAVAVTSVAAILSAVFTR